MERKKIFFLGVVSNYGSNLVSILVGLISVPVALNYFGPVRYGIYAVITSLVGYLSMSTLGINTASAILISKTTNYNEQKKILFASFRFVLITSMAMLFIVILLAYINPDVISILGKIPLHLKKEVFSAVFFAALLFLINLPITIFLSAFIGFQQFYWERIYFSLGMVLSLVALLLTIYINGTLVEFIVIRGFATIIVSVSAAIHFIYKNNGFTFFRYSKNHIECDKKNIIFSGLRFFSLSMSAMIVWNTDNLVINHFLGPESVTQYAVAFKIFSMIFMVFTAINSTLFPMIGRAAGLMQWEWIQSIYRNVTQSQPVIGGIVWLGGIAFAEPIIGFWAGQDAIGGTLLIFALGGYGYLLSMVNMHSYLLTGLNETKHLVLIGWSEALANLLLSIFLVKLWGVGGVALGTFLGSLITCFWMLPLDIHLKTKHKVTFDYKPILFNFAFLLFPSLILLFIFGILPLGIVPLIIIKMIIIVNYIALSVWFMSNDVKVFLRDKLAEIRFKLLFSQEGLNDL